MVYKADYVTHFSKIEEESKQTLYSIQDVNKNLEATDVYIEKYFPVRIQEMINAAFKHFAESDEEKEKVLDYEVQRVK